MTDHVTVTTTRSVTVNTPTHTPRTLTRNSTTNTTTPTYRGQRNTPSKATRSEHTCCDALHWATRPVQTQPHTNNSGNTPSCQPAVKHSPAHPLTKLGRYLSPKRRLPRRATCSLNSHPNHWDTVSSTALPQRRKELGGWGGQRPSGRSRPLRCLHTNTCSVDYSISAVNPTAHLCLGIHHHATHHPTHRGSGAGTTL